jgi:Ca2+-transporting ATPase
MPAFFRGNPTFFVVMGAVVLAQVLIIQYGGAIFGTVPLSLNQWVTVVAATASVLVIGLVLRIIYPLWQGRKTVPA